MLLLCCFQTEMAEETVQSQIHERPSTEEMKSRWKLWIWDMKQKRDKKSQSLPLFNQWMSKQCHNLLLILTDHINWRTDDFFAPGDQQHFPNSKQFCIFSLNTQAFSGWSAGGCINKGNIKKLNSKWLFSIIIVYEIYNSCVFSGSFSCIRLIHLVVILLARAMFMGNDWSATLNNLSSWLTVKRLRHLEISCVE